MPQGKGDLPADAASGRSRRGHGAFQLDAKPNAQSKAVNATVRVNTDKLDALMDVVGELVIVQSQLSETARRYGAVAPTLSGNDGHLGRLTKELQYNAMSLRMIAIQPTFQKMERLIRDLARECGKKAAFTTAGGDTEIDRSMVEEIADPLVHMVRNSLDHGLETPEQRVAAGKPETGTVSLRAFHQGGKVLIEMRDDGRGLNREKILAKARQKGLVAPDAQPTPDEILQMIFLPGFSTAEKVTAVSGRGVGMDVSCGATSSACAARSRSPRSPARAPSSRSSFPLTMAIIDGLVVRVGSQRFVLPTTSVQRAVCLASDSIVPIQGCGEAVDLRGRPYPAAPPRPHLRHRGVRRRKPRRNRRHPRVRGKEVRPPRRRNGRQAGSCDQEPRHLPAGVHQRRRRHHPRATER